MRKRGGKRAGRHKEFIDKIRVKLILTKINQFKKISFNFHDIVGLQIDSESSAVRDFFISEYKSYQVDFLSDHLPCVRLIFKNSLIFSVKKKEYTRHVHKFFARFYYRIRITDKNININVIGNRISILIVHHFLVHPGMRFLVSKEQGLMLHASTIYKNGYSILFSGQSGKGKTTAISLVLMKGHGNWDFHSDDYIFLTVNAPSLTYQTPLHFYRDHLRWFPELCRKFTPQEHIKLHFFGFLRKFSRDRIKLPVRVSHDRLWPDYAQAKKSIPKAIFLIEASGNRPFHCRLLAPDNEMIEQWFEMNFAELQKFLALVKKNENIPQFEEWAKKWRDREKEHLKQQLKSIKIYQIQAPVLKNASNTPEINNFLKFLDHIISSC